VQQNRVERAETRLIAMREKMLKDNRVESIDAYFPDYVQYTLTEAEIKARLGKAGHRDFLDRFCDHALQTMFPHHRYTKVSEAEKDRHVKEFLNDVYRDYLVGNKRRRTAYQYAQQFVQNLYITGKNDKVKWGMVFTGPTGTGKTLLASIITRELVAQNIPAWFVRVRELLKNVQAGYDQRVAYTMDQMVGFFSDFPVLILDEFDVNKKSEDRMDILEDIINYRYRYELPTVITTNLSQGELRDAWGDRIYSRVVDMSCWFLMTWDLRDKALPEG
jgi:DNA replication protein DnaC